MLSYPSVLLYTHACMYISIPAPVDRRIYVSCPSLLRHTQGSADIGAETARRDRERKSRDAEATVQSSANEVRTVARGEEGIVTTTDTGGKKVYQRQEEKVVESSKDLTTNRTIAKVTGNRKGKKAR